MTQDPRFGGAGGDAEAEVLGHQRHRRDQEDGVVHRHLRAVADGGLVAAAVDVVGAEHVGDEDAVEGAALQQLGQLGPVGEVLVAPGLVVGVAPHAGGLVGDAVHVERVETDLPGHGSRMSERGRPRIPSVTFRNDDAP